MIRKDECPHWRSIQHLVFTNSVCVSGAIGISPFLIYTEEQKNVYIGKYTYVLQILTCLDTRSLFITLIIANLLCLGLAEYLRNLPPFTIVLIFLYDAIEYHMHISDKHAYTST